MNHQEPSMHILRTLNVAFTHKCNLRCYHCYVDETKKNKPDAALELWKNWFEQAKKMGVEYISFGGGESFVRQDFIELLEYIYTLGIPAGIITNGTYPKKIATLPKKYIHTLSVSLDFSDPKLHDDSRGKAGCYKEALRSIEAGIHIGARIEVLTTVTKHNCNIDNLNALQELLQDIGVSDWKLNRFKVLGRGGFSDIDLSQNQLKLYHKFIIKHRRSSDVVEPILAGIYGVGRTKVSCPCAETTIRIGNDGSLYPCVYVDKAMGSLQTDSLRYYWNKSPEISAFRRLKDIVPKECMLCPGVERCGGGCVANAFTLGKTNGKFRDPYCYVHESPSSSVDELVYVDKIIEAKNDMRGVVGSNYITLNS